jgi:glycosyltransferase involved in cell wall biosynthesis
MESRVIPTGVNRRVFRPAPRPEVRDELRLSRDATILLYAGANGIRRNMYKDFTTIHHALERLGGEAREHLMLLVVGDLAPNEAVGSVSIRYIPFQPDPVKLARYYQAADLFLYAAKNDTFPNTVLEALSCGTPVVATAVGGVPEQVKSLSMPWSGNLLLPDDTRVCDTYGDEEATGVLTPPADPDAMAHAIAELVGKLPLRAKLERNAAKDAHDRFDIEDQVTAYLSWYQGILHTQPSHRTADSLNSRG